MTELPTITRWQPPGQEPNTNSVSAFLRGLGQYMKNLTNHENTDGMGQAGHVMADADYLAMSTNANAYNEPVDPALPTALNFVGTTSEGRAIMQHQNKEEWKNKVDER